MLRALAARAASVRRCLRPLAFGRRCELSVADAEPEPVLSWEDMRSENDCDGSRKKAPPAGNRGFHLKGLDLQNKHGVAGGGCLMHNKDLGGSPDLGSRFANQGPAEKRKGGLGWV